MKKIVIIVPIHTEHTVNQLRLLTRVLVGCKQQIVPDRTTIETIVFYNEYSLEKTVNIARDLGIKVVLVPNEFNGNAAIKHKYCYDYCVDADYVMICQSDDIPYPTKCRAQYSVMDINKDAFCNCGMIVSRDGIYTNTDFLHVDPYIYWAGYNPSCWLINKHIVKELPCLLETPWAWDQVLFGAMLEMGNCKVLMNTLFEYNLHEDGGTHSIDVEQIRDGTDKSHDMLSKMKFKEVIFL